MHFNAYITSRYFLSSRMCGRPFDFLLVVFCPNLNGCRMSYIRMDAFEFAPDKSRMMPLKHNLISLLNLALDWHLYLFPKHPHPKPRWHFEYYKRLQRENTSCFESYAINLIEFLINRCREIFRKMPFGLSIVEGDRPRITKYTKRLIHRVFKVNQFSFSEQWPRSFTTNNLRRDQSVAELSLHNITLSLRKFAYEFAQHKEVPGDQLKPSKERIKNVNTRNQQRRC